jgi:signal peptidase I
MKMLELGKDKRELLKKLEFILFAIVTLGAVSLPFILGTSTYPLAIVQGNSMYPTLQNGDLVLFQGSPSSSEIPNGTIIIFVQSYTGIPLLDSLTKPIVIHRIVGEVIQQNGTVYYRTKGDNNLQNDSQLVPANHVLGIPVKVIPRVGIALLFIGSPQGLVAVVTIIVIFYLGKMDVKARDDEKRERFLGTLAQMVLNNELPQSIFEKFEIASRYVKILQMDELKDNVSMALVDWMKKGGLEHDWKANNLKCPKCSTSARSFEGAKGNLLVVCPTCITNDMR